MARLIDADVLIEHIDHCIAESKGLMRSVCVAIKCFVQQMPTVDAVPVVHGRWKYYHKQNMAVCTNCSFERDLDANFGKAVSCSNCGARMDLKE